MDFLPASTASGRDALPGMTGALRAAHARPWSRLGRRKPLQSSSDVGRDGRSSSVPGNRPGCASGGGGPLGMQTGPYWIRDRCPLAGGHASPAGFLLKTRRSTRWISRAVGLAGTFSHSVHLPGRIRRVGERFRPGRPFLPPMVVDRAERRSTDAALRLRLRSSRDK